MHAFRINRFTDPPVLQDIPDPGFPGPGQVRIAIKACGLNFADLLMARGTYQDMPDPPLTLGMEIAGTITNVGPGVTDWQPGARVAVYGGHGGLAEFGLFPASRCVALPETMDAETAAAFQIAYGTSHMALDYKAGLKPGETLLVLGAAGGVGLTAVEIGKLMGARVVAVARGEHKRETARRAGADLTFDSTAPDLKAQLKTIGGVDVVFDSVGGDATRAALSACAPEARILLIGFASGDLPDLPPNHLLVKNVSVMGFWWGGFFKFNPKPVTDSLATLFKWQGEGRLAPHISYRLPLERAAEGLDLLSARQATGKVVIRVA